MNYDQPYPSRRVPVLARNVVATSQPLAAQAGVRMLLAGGNAVDAAIAAAIALTVVEPTGNGLGSDAFAILWDGAALHGLNASGRSPAAWTPARFAGRPAMPQTGWDSVTVPGAVSAWVALSRRFGRLPFADLFAPAIHYAERGFAVSPTIADAWAYGAARLANEPGFAATFLPGGRPPRPGELFRNPDLAASLRTIAETEGEAFYRGDLARRIAADAARHGAALTEDDLAVHAPDWCGTISKDFEGHTIHEIPPNGQGIAALVALGLLAHTDAARRDPDDPVSLHLQIEAMKLALADADRFVADPAHMDTPPEALLDDTYLADRAARIDPACAQTAEAGAPRAGGTVYLAAADESGMMVSFIQSNYMDFGSGVVVPGTGIALQNRGAGFTLTPGHANEVGPRKRPFHTIIPGFAMKDGAPEMSCGVMGGPMQAQGHVQMVMRCLIAGQNPQAASDAPRWRFISGRTVAMETAMPEATRDRLAAMGHEIVLEPPDTAFGMGGAQLIRRAPEGYVAGSDHRKDGCAAGF
jgi:gamma-glutamyltranspeptidase/glutathione hydrolase